MAFMRGEPLLSKLSALSQYVVLPGAMIAALFYSPPRYGSSSSSTSDSKTSGSSK
ncbi:unnamed protein product [Linum tenue]|uniref:Uncharacterized protein n=1 Tax=Linum tenue TaxID=586396 RepID=A0AAV0H9B9_9ROSI|nr:unnamed protein product [Linum tenue]